MSSPAFKYAVTRLSKILLSRKMLALTLRILFITRLHNLVELAKLNNFRLIPSPGKNKLISDIAVETERVVYLSPYDFSKKSFTF